MPYKSLTTYKNNARYIQLDNHRLAYWQHENEHVSETVLFIHGFPSASWDWHNQWQAMSTGFNLVAMDMLGFGLSDKPLPHQYRLTEQAGYYERLLQHLNIKHCHILAHDYGDSVAQHLLHLHQAGELSFAPRSITFLNGGLFSESHRPLLTQKLLKSPIGSLLVKLLSQDSLQRSFKKIFGAETPPERQDVQILWQLLQFNNGAAAMPSLLRYIDERKLHREDWVSAMQKTDVPLYFINGAQDPISGEHMRLRYCEIISNARTVSLAVGHYPQIEAAEEVINLFRRFLREDCNCH